MDMAQFVTHRSELIPTIPKTGCITGPSVRVHAFLSEKVQIAVGGMHAEMTPDAAIQLAHELMFAAELATRGQLNGESKKVAP